MLFRSAAPLAAQQAGQLAAQNSAQNPPQKPAQQPAQPRVAVLRAPPLLRHQGWVGDAPLPWVQSQQPAQRAAQLAAQLAAQQAQRTAQVAAKLAARLAGQLSPQYWQISCSCSSFRGSSVQKHYPYRYQNPSLPEHLLQHPHRSCPLDRAYRGRNRDLAAKLAAQKPAQKAAQVRLAVPRVTPLPRLRGLVGDAPLF